MGIVPSDVIFFTALHVAVSDLRKNLYLVDDMLSMFTSDPYLKKLYGKKEIDRFKNFLATKEINILMEHRLKDMGQYPAIVIAIDPAQEDTGKAALGDSHTQESASPSATYGAFEDPQIVLGPITPVSYDKDTGIVTFEALTDGSGPLVNVFEGQKVYDEKNKMAYEIQAVLDDFSLMIDTDLKADLTGMTIRTISNQVIHTRKSIWYYETYRVAVLSTEPSEALFLYALVMYILGRYKKTLFEARGFEISTVSYGGLENNSPDDTNQLYGRVLTVRGRVEHSFIESTTEQIQGIGHNLLINPNVDEGLASPDSILEIVQKQGWMMEKDKDKKPK